MPRQRKVPPSTADGGTPITIDGTRSAYFIMSIFFVATFFPAWSL